MLFVIHVICIFKLHSEYLNSEALQRFGDFRIREKVISTVKYVDDCATG